MSCSSGFWSCLIASSNCNRSPLLAASCTRAIYKAAKTGGAHKLIVLDSNMCACANPHGIQRNKMAAVSPEIDFARKLACNDLETRQKSEKLLKDWLRKKAKKGMKEMEMKILWKGLFASMFMSDKPLVQEQLAYDLSKLVHFFSNYNIGIQFCCTFFNTMAREWHGIDRLRLDKYYLLIRSCTHECFIYLQAQGWPEKAVKELMDAIVSHHQSCPGLLLHIVELFLTELQNAASDKLPSAITLLLLKPWLDLAGMSKDKVMVKLIEENIFSKIVKGHKVKYLSIDWTELGTVVWEVASNQDTLTRNRRILHQLHTKINEKM